MKDKMRNMEYGGQGGIPGGRQLLEDDEFEQAVNRAFGEIIRYDKALGQQLWSAITDVRWKDAKGNIAYFSHRRAGDLVAAIRGMGDYLDWAWNSPSGQVSDFIRDSLKNQGWEIDVIYL